MTRQDEGPPSRFETWPDLAQWLLSVDHSGWVFRGHADAAWRLDSRLQRSLSGVAEGAWKDREDLAVGQFKSLARRELADPPPDSDVIGWLSLMQHYGAPTRLLDWTESPFVALWFAYADPALADEGALWLLWAAACRQAFGSAVPFGRDHLGVVRSQTYQEGELIEESFPGEGYDHRAAENSLVRHAIRESLRWPLPISPLDPDPRMFAQQSLFTVDGSLLGIPEDLAHQVPAFEFASTGADADSGDTLKGFNVRSVPLLHKVDLPGSWRREVLQSLRTMGISAATVFPGLDGVGQDVALSLNADLRLSFRDVLDGRMDPRRESHS